MRDQSLKKYPHLFEPFLIPPVKLKNRMTMAPLFTAYANPDGTVSSLMLDHYGEVARGGASMVVVANASVDPSGTLSRFSLRADEDRFLPRLSKLAQTIQKEGAAAVLQVNHGGRFANGEVVYAPSVAAIGDVNIGGFYRTVLKNLDLHEQLTVFSEILHRLTGRPKEMSVADIRRIITAYVEAATRAKKAGFDMVEIHGGTGYLPVQFLSARTNLRNDEYGGSLENRMRFALELTKAVKKAVGADFPVGYRFLADEWLPPDGFSLGEAKVLAERLARLGVAYLSVTAGTYESFCDPEIIEKSHEQGYMVYLAHEVKEVVKIPVVATGRITTPELAEEILKARKADLIGLARPLFADPEWLLKTEKGEEETIVLCKDCGTCFRATIAERPVVCPLWDKTKLIKRKELVKEMRNPRKKLLIAMDGSESATLGAAYAAEMLANRKDVCITLVHIQTEESIKNEKQIEDAFGIARSFLTKAGIPDEAISVQVRKKRIGVARDILDEIKEGGYGTVVVGRRGISKAQQFLFGSVSNKIVQNAKDCAVWVVD